MLITRPELESIVCDICNTETPASDIGNIQEFHRVRFTGGYDSIFGDGARIECDICQHCLKTLLAGKYREVN